jgi:hypothetical protein
MLTLKIVIDFGKVTAVSCNNYLRISGKIGFTIENIVLIIINNQLIFNRFLERQGTN